jgi:hypothetical protein
MATPSGFATLPFGEGPFGGVAVVNPTLTISTATQGTVLKVTNPKPGDERPLLGNYIERRSRPTEPWRRVATIGVDGSFTDFDVRDGAGYQYRALAYGPAPTILAPSNIVGTEFQVEGVSFHRPSDPTGSFKNFIYQGGQAKEQRSKSTQFRSFLGRARPVADFGVSGDSRISREVMIPWGPTHDEDVAWWRTAVDTREVLVMRDSRRRRITGVIDGEIGLVDEVNGTSVSFTFVEVDYVAEG